MGIRLVNHPVSKITTDESFNETDVLRSDKTKGLFDISLFDQSYFDNLGNVNIKIISTQT